MKMKKNKGLWKKKRIAKEKAKTAKEAGRRKRNHWKKRPTKKRVDEF